MFKMFLSTIAIVFAFSGCGGEEESKKLKIAVNSWIGYTPVFDIKEREVFKNSIEFIPVVSLGESLNLYKLGIIDGFTGTQYEFFSAKESGKDIQLVISIDRSSGGDAIVSNRTVEQLKTLKSVDVYLEASSVNIHYLKQFNKKYGFDKKLQNIHSLDQLSISKIDPNGDPKVIVTYNPYLSTLLENGFQVISSTKIDKDIIILDGIFLKKDLIEENRELLINLKSEIDNSIKSISSEKQEFYNRVSKYIEGDSYENFEKSLHEIEWINIGNRDLEQRLNQLDIETKYWIK